MEPSQTIQQHRRSRREIAPGLLGNTLQRAASFHHAPNSQPGWGGSSGGRQPVDSGSSQETKKHSWQPARRQVLPTGPTAPVSPVGSSGRTTDYVAVAPPSCLGNAKFYGLHPPFWGCRLSAAAIAFGTAIDEPPNVGDNRIAGANRSSGRMPAQDPGTRNAYAKGMLRPPFLRFAHARRAVLALA